MTEQSQLRGQPDTFTVTLVAVKESDAVVTRNCLPSKFIYLRTSTTEEELYSISRKLFYAESPYKIEAEIRGVKEALLIDRRNCFSTLLRLENEGGQLVFYYTKDVDR